MFECKSWYVMDTLKITSLVNIYLWKHHMDNVLKWVYLAD